MGCFGLLETVLLSSAVIQTRAVDCVARILVSIEIEAAFACRILRRCDIHSGGDRCSSNGSLAGASSVVGTHWLQGLYLWQQDASMYQGDKRKIWISKLNGNLPAERHPPRARVHPNAGNGHWMYSPCDEAFKLSGPLDQLQSIPGNYSKLSKHGRQKVLSHAESLVVGDT